MALGTSFWPAHKITTYNNSCVQLLLMSTYMYISAETKYNGDSYQSVSRYGGGTQRRYDQEGEREREREQRGRERAKRKRGRKRNRTTKSLAKRDSINAYPRNIGEHLYSQKI